MLIEHQPPCRVCGGKVKAGPAEKGWAVWCDKPDCLIVSGYKSYQDAMAAFEKLEAGSE